MQFQQLSILGLILIKPNVFGDNRGFFKETYNKEEFQKNGINMEWIQDNHSRSVKGVLRGLHWQREPFAQEKLVRVARGTVLDVAVDIRVGSPTFGKYEAVELSDENHNMFLVPKGFAHGFYVLSERADVFYKCTNYYQQGDEACIRWDCPTLAIDWPLSDRWPLSLSDKDRQAPNFVRLI